MRLAEGEIVQDNIIVANDTAGQQNWAWLNQWPPYDRLRDFGFGEPLIEDWRANPRNREYWGAGLDHCLDILRPAMNRLDPNGITRLGRYIHDIAEQLKKFWNQGTIVDFGCGPWIEASLSLARNSKFKIQLIEVRPLPLAFASWQLSHYGIPHIVTPVCLSDEEISLVASDAVMIVESTAFEHVKDIRYLFEPLMRRLPQNGLFLTNYTRVDWTLDWRDGFNEAHEFAPRAIDIALSLAHRYEWEPSQDNWDLWRMK